MSEHIDKDELYRIALTWTDGDKDRAALIVSAYLRGQVDRAIVQR